MQELAILQLTVMSKADNNADQIRIPRQILNTALFNFSLDQLFMCGKTAGGPSLPLGGLNLG